MKLDAVQENGNCFVVGRSMHSEDVLRELMHAGAKAPEKVSVCYQTWNCGRRLQAVAVWPKNVFVMVAAILSFVVFFMVAAVGG